MQTRLWLLNIPSWQKAQPLIDVDVAIPPPHRPLQAPPAAVAYADARRDQRKDGASAHRELRTIVGPSFKQDLGQHCRSAQSPEAHPSRIAAEHPPHPPHPPAGIAFHDITNRQFRKGGGGK